MIRDATQGAPRRFPDGPKMLFQPSKMAKIGWEPTQDELTQDEGEYFSMGPEPDGRTRRKKLHTSHRSPQNRFFENLYKSLFLL